MKYLYIICYELSVSMVYIPDKNNKNTTRYKHNEKFYLTFLLLVSDMRETGVLSTGVPHIKAIILQ